MVIQSPDNEPLNLSTRLAFDRTRLAHDRTMMAWVRTATSLITFGFTIDKFFEFHIGKGGKPYDGIIGPREFALLMISIGLFSLVIATIQHRVARNALRTLDPEVPRSMAAVLAGLIAILGVVALLSVVLRQ
jgi:putative membrane protein